MLGVWVLITLRASLSGTFLQGCRKPVLGVAVLTPDGAGPVLPRREFVTDWLTALQQRGGPFTVVLPTQY